MKQKRLISKGASYGESLSVAGHVPRYAEALHGVEALVRAIHGHLVGDELSGGTKKCLDKEADLW